MECLRLQEGYKVKAKKDGKWIEVKCTYAKVNGHWVEPKMIYCKYNDKWQFEK